MTKGTCTKYCAAFGVAVPPRAQVRAFKAVLLGVFTATSLTPALAETYYVDLFRGSPEGDGSLSRPWLDLDRVLFQEPLQPGDEVYLGGGAWGTLRLEGISFAEPGLFLTSFPPETPKLDGLEIANSHGLHLSVMVVQAGENDRTDLVRIDAASSDITIEEFDIISAPDTRGWTREQWQSIPRNAIRSDGKDVRISGNWIETVRHGVQSTGPGAIIEANIISQFTGDAIRVLGDGSTVHGNEIFNCLDVDGNHDDAIQSWSIGEDGMPGTGVVSDVTISANFIFERRAPIPAFPCALQGIGLFDGMYEGWVIENNVIAVSAWHGITMMGAKDGIIRNNTLVGVAGNSGPPWISVTRHKDGREASRTRIVNNLIPDAPTPPSAPFGPVQPGVTWINNFIVADPSAVFARPERFDFSLLDGSPATGAAIPADTPDRDILGVLRRGGADLGAFDAP